MNYFLRYQGRRVKRRYRREGGYLLVLSSRVRRDRGRRLYVTDDDWLAHGSVHPDRFANCEDLLRDEVRVCAGRSEGRPCRRRRSTATSTRNNDARERCQAH